MFAQSSIGEPSSRIMTRSRTLEHKRVVSARQHNGDLGEYLFFHREEAEVMFCSEGPSL